MAIFNSYIMDMSVLPNIYTLEAQGPMVYTYIRQTMSAHLVMDYIWKNILI